MMTAVNGEPVPETAGSTSVRWEGIPGGHRYCDAEITRLRERVGRAETKLAEYENAISWNTSCTSCAKLLDSCTEERERAERAEAELAQAVTAERERIRGLFDEWITLLMSEPNAHPPEAWKAAFADLIAIGDGRE